MGNLYGPFNRGFITLAHSGSAIANTGNTTENILATVALPAGMMGANGMLRILTTWSYPNSGNNKTMRVRLGGIGGSELVSLVRTTGEITMNHWMVVSNRNSQSSQVMHNNQVTAQFGVSGLAVTTTAVNTAVAQDIVITAQCASAAETITLERYHIEVLRG